ncbi:hypothetical protein KC19_4G051300 [Ceratodon purpureus]|uniref:Uncharacterized protein n=1 Tax=Ceratodon purpureus TaxID=3225 RepID=A0A8T0I764_CERPU|nr:hypothetical protein KC19_4G051300 [Ceratodon purpureus]
MPVSSEEIWHPAFAPMYNLCRLDRSPIEVGSAWSEVQLEAVRSSKLGRAPIESGKAFRLVQPRRASLLSPLRCWMDGGSISNFSQPPSRKTCIDWPMESGSLVMDVQNFKFKTRRVN